MALFKILRGPSSELSKMPINDGYCYFTPDTGLFHIDYDGQRVPLNSKNALSASNATSAIMTEGIIDQNSKKIIKLWYGSTAEYEAISTKDENTVYMLSDGESSSINAIDIAYDNSISKLSATDIQDAIDEIATTAGKAGYVLETNKNLQQKFWRGTKEEYDAVETKDEDTMYIVVDGEGENVVGGNGVADWAQNDPEGEGYIKNRTHYSEITVETLYDGSVTTSGRWNLTQNNPINFIVIENGEYEVVYDGTTYNVIAVLDDSGNPYIGSYTLWQNLDYIETEPPFCYADGWFGTSVDGDHSVKIFGPAETINKIDKKYLPNSNISNGTGAFSVVEGYYTLASGDYSHAEGYFASAMGEASSAEGYVLAATGEFAHAEGRGDSVPLYLTGVANSSTYTLSKFTDVIRVGCVVRYDQLGAIITEIDSDAKTITVNQTLNPVEDFDNSYAELIYRGIASGRNSHIEGDGNWAKGNASHAEGWKTIAEGGNSHAEGSDTIASGKNSHAEGGHTTASGECSHAEGIAVTASGMYSHAEGGGTTASGMYSHAEGIYTTASGRSTHVQGEYNILDTAISSYDRSTYAHIVGNGTSSVSSNAHTLDWNGNAWFAGDVYVGSTYGRNKDEGSKKLVTVDEMNAAIAAAIEAAFANIATVEGGNF